MTEPASGTPAGLHDAFVERGVTSAAAWASGAAGLPSVVIGREPHERSGAIQARAPDASVLDGGRSATDG